MLGIGPRGPTGSTAPDPAAGQPREPGPAPDPEHGYAADRPGSGPDAAERDAWVLLAGVHGVGPVSFERLIGAYGSATAVLAQAMEKGGAFALVSASRDADGGRPTLALEAARAVGAAAGDAERRLAPLRASGLRVVTLADEAYPSRLRRIELPPPVLFLRGQLEAMDRRRAIAIVGTRRPTEAGRGLAGRIAESVSSLDATVISGLALGIDGAAHAASLRGRAPTVAVIGGGHERLYPAAHRGMVEQIVAAGGAVVSEFAPDVEPSRGTFPRRNRIISGLADATVVVEAGARSGALTTAAWALEQGRGLHIVPGRVGDPSVAGCLAFLREAAAEARIVVGIPELLEDLGLLDDAGPRDAGGSFPRAGAPALDAVLAGLGPAERAVARRVAQGIGSVDELAAATGVTGATILGTLTALELRGLVLEAYGRYRPAGVLARAGRPGPGIPVVGARGPGRAA